MIARVRQLYANAGAGGVVRAVFMHLLFLGLPVLLLSVDDSRTTYWTRLVIAIAVAWALPVFVRRWLVRDPELASSVLNGGSFVVYGLGFASGLLSRAVDSWLLIGLFFPVGSAYSSLCWWILSDPRITVPRPR